jgi:hypothetical protein
VSPIDDYRSRLVKFERRSTLAERDYRRFGNARLVTGLAAVAIAGVSIGVNAISPWWLAVPIVGFIALTILLSKLDDERQTAARGVAYYERGIGRIENRWIGKGSSGERFRDGAHVYSDDLDLFGRGSLFERISTARTGAGEKMLASWFVAPSARDEIAARQQAVQELCSRVDLREEIALMGENIRAAVDASDLAKWGEAPPVSFFPGARIVAPLLAAAAVATIALYFAHEITGLPFLGVILLQMLFRTAIRPGVVNVVTSVSAPAAELDLLSLLLARLERESFQSARLKALIAEMEVEGAPASRRIRQLTRMLELLDSARNQFFIPIAAAVLWVPQFAMAIEAWRRVCGPKIGKWIAAVGEFESICSLSSFAYENPDATFPILEENGHLFDAAELRHPLIPSATAIANDVTLGETARLWIVSGSNMSGKSTLLRAVGINAVLAWAGSPVACARLRISPIRIGASITTHDSLTDHRSRFYAEISRLRDIVDLAHSGQPVLFLLDELLSGTNSHDRRIGAEAVIRGLVERGAIGIVTTHDLALSEIVNRVDSGSANVHFEDHLEGGEIRFDYRLRPGVVTRSNALELMRAVGLDV